MSQLALRWSRLLARVNGSILASVADCYYDCVMFLVSSLNCMGSQLCRCMHKTCQRGCIVLLSCSTAAVHVSLEAICGGDDESLVAQALPVSLVGRTRHTLEAGWCCLQQQSASGDCRIMLSLSLGMRTPVCE